MILSNNNHLPIAIRQLLIFLIGGFFVLFSFSDYCLAQSPKDVELKFVKSNDSIKSSEMYFNVLKAWNNTTKPITGTLAFNGPDGWKIISFPEEKTTLLPGDTLSVPIRVSPTSNSLGGISYIINATFQSARIQTSASTYLTLPSLPKWEFSVNKNSAFFTESNPNTTVQIKLFNKGNTNETIKLKIDVGKLLAFADNSPNNNLEFIRLKAFADTVIVRTLTSQTKLNFAERMRYENNWKESAINIHASTEQTEKNSAIQIYKLNSIYVNQRAQSSSPLNIDYQLYNLMSSQTPRSNVRVFGSLLFPNSREIQYVFGVQNVSYDTSVEPFDFSRQLIYDVRYRDAHNNIQLGYNVSGGILHSINGRGIIGDLVINQRNTINYGFTQNQYSGILGEYVGYSTAINKLPLNTEITHEAKDDGSYQATSVMLGTGFNLFKYHTFSLQFLGSKSDYKKNLPRDTSVLGFSYRASYNVEYKKFYLRFSTQSSEYNYIMNSGLQQTYLDSRYTIKDNLSLSLYGNRQKYSITLYPYNFFNPINYNSNDNLRLTTSFSAGGLTYQIGPNYNGSVRQSFNSSSQYRSEYITYQPGIWGAITIKLPGYSTLTPNLTVSNLRFYFKTDDPALANYSSDQNFYYSAGISYYDQTWRVNAYYTSGSVSDMYRSVLVDTKPTVSRSIQFRPSYENYFFNRTVKLSASMNYAYYMPAGRENVSFNVRYDQYLKKGWNISVSGFMYSNTRVDEQMGRINTKDLNLYLGVTKSFNIQQPRLKYYDFKAVFFNDLDGNRIKSGNEPPVTDILVGIQKDQKASPGQSNIPEIKLITDANGAVTVENLPKDTYKLDFTPLLNLQSLYFLNGSVQSYYNDKERVMYIPLAESYKIRGRVIIVRDPNSTEGKIDFGGVRITAVGQKGETYSALTDNYGDYVLSVPNADKYKVHVNNVFGEQFNIEADEASVQFTQNKTINLDFTFIEKVRGIQFDNGGELFKFTSIENSDTTSAKLNDKNNEAVSEKTSKSYVIQVASTKTYRNTSYYKNKLKLKEDVLYTDSQGEYKYLTGDYPSLKAAKAAIVKLGIAGATAVAVDKSLLKSGTDVVSQNGTTSGYEQSNVQNIVVPRSDRNAIAGGKVVSESRQSQTMPAASNSVTQPATKLLTTSKNKKNTTSKIADVQQENSVEKNSLSTIKPEQSKTVTKVKGSANVSSPANTEAVSVSKQNNAVVNGKRSDQALPVSDNSQTKQQPTVNISNTVAPSNTSQTVEPNQQAAKTPIDNANYSYSIRLDAFNDYHGIKYYKEKYKFPFEVVCVEKNGVKRYYAGKYKSEEEATADIAKYGITGFIVPIEEAAQGKPVLKK